jgi:hypothetical protein
VTDIAADTLTFLALWLGASFLFGIVWSTVHLWRRHRGPDYPVIHERRRWDR